MSGSTTTSSDGYTHGYICQRCHHFVRDAGKRHRCPEHIGNFLIGTAFVGMAIGISGCVRGSLTLIVIGDVILLGSAGARFVILWKSR